MEISKEIEIITPLHESIWYEFLKSVRSTNLKSCPMLRVHVKKVEEENWFVSRGSNQQCTLIQNSNFYPKIFFQHLAKNKIEKIDEKDLTLTFLF